MRVGLLFRALLLGVLLLAPCTVLAQTATTTAAITLTPTFESIGVVAPFTGDTDDDNSVVIDWRVCCAGGFKAILCVCVYIGICVFVCSICVD